MLTNVVTNAIKYTPPGGQIRVTLRADGRDAVLVVEDTGAGISAELLPFIFDLYVQSDRTLDRARGGLGIGLTLVRRLVEAARRHGRRVERGRRTRQQVHVRLKAIPSPEASSGRAVSRNVAPKPRRVLLIEDSDEAREMLRMTLELAGHIVHDAADGVRGLELLNVVRPGRRDHRHQPARDGRLRSGEADSRGAAGPGHAAAGDDAATTPLTARGTRGSTGSTITWSSRSIRIIWRG